MNYYIIIPLCVAVVVLIIYLIKRNYRDEQHYEEFINYDKPNKNADDADDEEI